MSGGLFFKVKEVGRSFGETVNLEDFQCEKVQVEERRLDNVVQAYSDHIVRALNNDSGRRSVNPRINNRHSCCLEISYVPGNDCHTVYKCRSCDKSVTLTAFI